MVYDLKADEYSVISIGGAFKYLLENSLPEINFIAQMGNIVTNFPAFYYNRADNKFAPVFNLVIKVDQGVVTELFWDNDCYTCLTDTNCKEKTQNSLKGDQQITQKV
jgi:hypothetical protein